jgi:hypothetical protein
MKPLYKGLAVALLHVLIVLSLGGKLLYDRATRPRVWVRTSNFDPDLPIRGRYIALSLEVQAADANNRPQDFKIGYDSGPVELSVEKGQIVAHKSSHFTGMYVQSRGGTGQYFLSSPALFFLPEHADLPQTMHGAELWAEVTVPKNGPPRPIQLAVKRGNAWMPLTYK